MRHILMLITLLVNSADVRSQSHINETSVYNKLKFFAWLVKESPSAVRIAGSKDAAAIALLNTSETLLAAAQQNYDAGELEQADKSLSLGLKQMTTASRKIKDLDRVEAAHRQLFEQLQKHVKTFVEAFERVVQEKGDTSVNAMLDRKRLNEFISSADELYANAQLAEANQAMRQASDIIENSLRAARDREVLLHELTFGSLQEEYDYERERNSSYVLLIDVLQDKTVVSDASRDYINTILSMNQKLQQEARALASQGDLARAIHVLEQGTDKLSRALRVSGASF
ncbi:MAG: hypothetical protein WBN96_14495 [Gammaproteobacteria bacterium]